MANNKKATSKSKTRKTNTKAKISSKSKVRKPTVEEVRKVEEFRIEIIMWVIIAVALLLFISNFGIGGVVGTAVSNVLFGVFGSIAYIVPILLMLLCFFCMSNKRSMLAVLKTFAIAIFIIFVCGLFALITSKGNVLPKDYYSYSIEHKFSGGFIGGFLAYYLSKAFGLIGTYIIDIIVLIISFVLITGRSVIKGVQRGGQKVYESAKENNERIQEYRKIRSEEKKRRTDNKVYGVSNDTRIVEDNPQEVPAFVPETNDPVFETPSPIRQTKTSLTSDAMTEFTTVSTPKIVGDYAPEKEMEQDYMPEPEMEAEPVMDRVPRKTRSSLEEIEKAVDNVANEIIAEQQEIKEYIFPPVSLLSKGVNKRTGNTQSQLRETAQKLEQTLKTFGVNVTVTDISCGPSVTRYEVQPEIGVKVSRIVNLADDIKLNLAASDIRIEAPIPGKAAVGIEVPNRENVTVSFRDLIESDEFTSASSKLTFAIGKDIGGKIKIGDIAKMPHMLIAGATGSGKSVCINTIIMSILYKADPNDVKLILIDPKVVELNIYNGIPHLMIPVVTDAKKAAGALHWAVAEMTERYQKFAECSVRDIHGYNARVESIQVPEGQERPKKMPQIVIIVDELADLMMVASNDVEEAICRLTQLARACGIHLVIATQRPSVNVITGLIKANMPSRIAFAVTSGVDSRTILDMNGAEKLLGKGDMLYNPQGIPKPIRVQGAFVTDDEVAAVVRFVKEQNGSAFYNSDIQSKLDNMDANGNTTVSISGGDTGSDGRDTYFVEAAQIIIDKEKASIGMLQRYLKVGFNRAARIMDQLEEAGIVGPEEGTKPRKILMSPEELENFLEQGY